MREPLGNLRGVPTSDLNAMLADHARLLREGKPIPAGAEKALLNEKDRRLADPNSQDFRPSFF